MFITVVNTIMFFIHCTPINIQTCRWYPWIYRMPGMIVFRRCRHYDECTSIQCQPVIAMLFVRTFSTREWLSVTLFQEVTASIECCLLPVACSCSLYPHVVQHADLCEDTFIKTFRNAAAEFHHIQASQWHRSTSDMSRRLLDMKLTQGYAISIKHSFHRFPLGSFAHFL